MQEVTLVGAHKDGLFDTQDIIDTVGKNYPTVIKWLKGHNEPRLTDGLKIQKFLLEKHDIYITAWK